MSPQRAPQPAPQPAIAAWNWLNYPHGFGNPRHSHCMYFIDTNVFMDDFADCADKSPPPCVLKRHFEGRHRERVLFVITAGIMSELSALHASRCPGILRHHWVPLIA